MTRIPTSPPVIQKVKADNRPLWSVMIPVYNNIEFIEEAMMSVLSQSLPENEMEIEVIDDASTDGDVKTLVENIGGGRIKYFRQPVNAGSLRNFETCINRSKGHLVHLLHADDKVRNGYYKVIGELFKKYPEAGAAFCRFCYITEKGKELFYHSAENTEDGILKNWLIRLAEKQRIQYVAITVKREVYEKLGAFYGLTYAEDWEMWVRIAKHYPVAYTPKILADYRKHTMSISGKKFLNGDYLADLTHAMNLIQDHLPEEEKKQALTKAKTFYAHYALKIAMQLWNTTHNMKIVRMNIKKSLQMHTNYVSFYKIMKIYLRIAKSHLKSLLNK
jgi:glycosyltransferase involved in cell wall biosynthesis